MRIATFVPFAFFVMLILSLVSYMVFYTGDGARRASSVVGKPLPELAIENYSLTNKITLRNLKKGTVLLNFFATWCVPCFAEHPLLMQLRQKATTPIYGVAWHDSKENVKDWLKTLGNPYSSIGMDNKGNATIALGLSGVPETLIVKNGVIIYHFPGPLTKEIVNRDIIPLLK